MNTKKLLGLQVDHYKITEHIARGGMADVYKALDINLHRPVALKILLDMLAQDEQFVKRFQREALTVAKLDHPNIVQIYSTGLTPFGQPYLAMQYVDGGSMRDLLRRWKEQGKVAPAAQSLAIIRQLADALDVAHRANIVHRDLKPSNVLIRSDGTPVLVDLGIAAITGGDKLTQTGSLMGTPHYMSPEQIRGIKVDGRSDLYSLGVILYELLAGVRPFEADESIAVLHKHVYEAPVPLGQIRRDLSSQTQMLVATCLEKDPDRRYQTSAELIAAIDRALAAEGTGGFLPRTTVLLPDGESELLSQPHGKTVMLEPEKPGHSRWILTAVLVVAIMAFILVVGWFMGNGGGITIRGEASLNDSTPTLTKENQIGSAITRANEVEPDNSSKQGASDPPTATHEITATSTLPPTQTPLPTDTPLPPDTPTPEFTSVEIIAESAGGTPIEIIRFGSGNNKLLLVGGISSGYSPGTVSVAQRTISYFNENPQEIPDNVTLFVIENFNPDSTYDPGKRNGRFNANGVDLNRNWDCDWVRNADILGETHPNSGGSEPFSEPEVKGLRDFILREQPDTTIIWSARSQNGLVSPGLCGNRSLVSISVANTFGIGAGYEVLELKGTQGDISNWLDQQGFPAFFVLLPDYANSDWNNNLAGIKAVIDHFR